MIPILYGPDEVYFSNQGLGGLGDAQSVRVQWALNGTYELIMQYPVFGRRYADLTPRRIILASVGPGEQNQPFRIYRVNSVMLGYVTVYARHVVYDLMGYTVVPFQAAGLAQALDQLQGAAMVEAHGFTLATDKTSEAACTVAVPRSVWSMLGGQKGSLLDIYGGEWEFDRYAATLRQAMGQDLGVVVRYGKNLQTLEQEENIANTWTAVQPYWASADGLTVVTLPERTVSAGEFDYTRILVLDLSAEWEEAPTEDQLRTRTKAYISDNDVGIPAVGLDVQFVSLTQTEEYEDRAFLEDVHKGDSVAVEFPTAFDRETGEPRAFVRAKARVAEYVWLPLEDKYESVRLGKPRANFVSALAQLEKNVEWVMSRTR